MNEQQAWQQLIGKLELEMSKAAFDTWVRSAEFLEYNNNCFKIGVQNAYALDWLQSRLSSTIKRILAGLMDGPQDVEFVIYHKDYVEQEQASTQADELLPVRSEPLLATGIAINARYTFDNFVVGSSNRLAHAACMAVAEAPAHAYNPLFLYGGVGLGKTHLLHAIGNHSLKKGLNVLYVTSEEFTNDLINSIRTHSTPAFRDRYRQVDVLLIDDIQFIAGKESTQEEFFHTFNTLHGQDKQIVISSDRPPKAMMTLEERLRSRFEWGLTADIQAPDVETRIAILRSKAERARRDVPHAVLEMIANQVQSNIRELEGALTRVLAYSDLRGEPLSLELASIALADMIPVRNNLEPRRVVDVVATAFGITPEKLVGRSRTREVALPRQVAMYLLRQEGNVSLPQIGAVLGGRDHTTVIYACEKVAELIQQDDSLRKRISKIRETLFSGGPVR